MPNGAGGNRIRTSACNYQSLAIVHETHRQKPVSERKRADAYDSEVARPKMTRAFVAEPLAKGPMHEQAGKNG